MKIEVKTIALTKSKIMQMDYIGIPKNKDAKVLGWVNMLPERWTIVESEGCYYRAEFVDNILKESKAIQFRLEPGGWEFPILTKVTYDTFNKGNCICSVHRNDSTNISLYEQLKAFRLKTIEAGQIYY